MKKINCDDSIEYKVLVKRYGRAMFEICPVFKYGYLRKVFIYLHQRPNRKVTEWVFDVGKDNNRINVFQITSWTHKTEHPNIWREMWCKEHKTICHSVYVPDKTNKLTFDFHLGNTFEMRFE